MENKAAILVSKLLRLAEESPSSGEATAAANRAEEIIKKFGLSQDDINTVGLEGIDQACVPTAYEKLQPRVRVLAEAVATLFSGQVVYTHRNVPTSLDRQFASSLFAGEKIRFQLETSFPPRVHFEEKPDSISKVERWEKGYKVVWIPKGDDKYHDCKHVEVMKWQPVEARNERTYARYPVYALHYADGKIGFVAFRHVRSLVFVGRQNDLPVMASVFHGLLDQLYQMGTEKAKQLGVSGAAIIRFRNSFVRGVAGTLLDAVSGVQPSPLVRQYVSKHWPKIGQVDPSKTVIDFVALASGSEQKIGLNLPAERLLEAPKP